MQILLCAATEFEISPTIDRIKKKNWDIDTVITGVGLTAATYQLTKAVYTKRPSLLLQAGIAGAFDRNFPLAGVVAVENEIIGDLGVVEDNRFQSLFDLKLDDPNTVPWTQGKLHNPSNLLKQVALPLVDGISINEISTSTERIAHYRSVGAGIESMEGAALHYVGLMEKISFLQIRSVSNFVGERDKGQWKSHEAINSLNLALQTILLKLM